MTRLFIALYTDEDVDILVADLLRARGFDVLTTRDALRLHATDEEQLAFSATEGRALLTHNRADFEALHQAYKPQGRTMRASLSRHAILHMRSCVGCSSFSTR